MQPQYTIELGGKFRILKYDMNSLMALEEKLAPAPGDNIVDVVFNGPKRFTSQVTLVWAGLMWEGWDDASDRPTLRVKEVADLMTPLLKDPKTRAALMEDCAKAFFSAFPEPDKKKDEDEPKNAQSAPGE